MDVTEKDFKNRAYAFIIATGLMNEYKRFCEVSKNVDSHQLCMMMMEHLAERTNN